MKGKEAVVKLLKEQRRQVAGTFYREDLRHIDLVWGEVHDEMGKIKGHGLSKILENHLDDFKDFEGANALEKLGNGIEQIVQRGEITKRQGRAEAYNIEYNGFVVGVNKGYNKQGDNYWVATAFDKKKPIGEKTPKTARAKDLTKEADNLPLNSNKELTTPPLKSLTPLQQALERKKAKEEASKQALEAKEAKYKAQREEQELEREAALAQKESQAGTKENQKDLKLGTPIPMQRLQGRSSSVSLDDERIYPLDFVIVKSQDVKPSFNTGVGTQQRTQTNSKVVEQIAQNFKPEMVLNRGGFDDLVIAGNHRAKGGCKTSPPKVDKSMSKPS
ncbi:putative barnase/colicin E5 family endoribonuclease [Helicobacter felis]|uniref:putative barnase/colicin E5 family endoribonuclease n=1 Tax=Helicobacter felis TaxID=214 RepID=UPI0013158CB8|nr:hypothetical protein [Helicobacter felis]